MLEVELKFQLADAPGFHRRLLERGATESETVTQADAYYNHPSRDFAVTDEALRLRTVGDESVVTLKGPKEGKLAKTRFELELPLAPDTAAGWAEVLIKLSFRHVATVKKQRTPYHLERAGRSFEITIDAVDGLGWFAEIETLADATSRDAAERAVLDLVGELGLSNPEPRSYLEMLLIK